MYWSGFFAWLFSSAGAGWVFGVVSVCALAWTVRNRKRPNRLVCVESARGSFLDIPDSFRKNIAVMYNDSPVNSVTWVGLKVVNTGSDVLKDITISIKFPKGVTVLEGLYRSEPINLALTASVQQNEVILPIPFINPVKEHRHRISAMTLIDGKADTIQVTGGGENWSLVFRKIPSWETQKRTLMLLVGIAIVEICVYLTAINLLWPQFRITGLSSLTVGQFMFNLPWFLLWLLTCFAFFNAGKRWALISKTSVT